MYKTHGEDTDFLYKPPPPNSRVVKATQTKSHARSDVTPANRESKKLDSLGKRQYSFATFSLRAANYVAAMGAYHRHLWNTVLPLFQALPNEVKTTATSLHKEAMSLSKQELIAARHLVDVSSRQATTAIALRRHAWLKATTLPEDAKTRIEEMPFDGIGLFNTKTDDILKEHQQMKRTAKSYAAPSTSRPFNTQWRKPYTSQQYSTCPRQNTNSTPYSGRQPFNRARPKSSFRRQDRKGKQGF